MLIFRLAWRSILRHKRRSIITICAVALSLTMMLWFKGMGDDGHARMAELGIRMGAGHVLVQGNGYQRFQTLDYLVTDPATVRARARALPQVSQVAPRVRASGLLRAGESSAPVVVSGVDPDLEPQISEIPAAKRRTAGAYLRPRAKMEYANQPADIYVGQQLAKTLNLAVGDRTVLTLSPKDASRPASAAFFVRGIFKTGITEMDSAYVEVPLTEVQQLLKIGNQVTQLAVHVQDLQDADQVAAALQRALPEELEVLPWQEALKELYEAIVLDDAGGYLMMAIIFIIVAIGIFNTIMMSVVERTKEFGVMMALGTRPGQLFLTVVAEGFLLAVVSALFGLAGGLGIHAWMSSVGVDITALAGDYEIAGIVMEGRIYSRLTVWVVARWTLVVMGLTVASSLYPALRTTRLKPVEAFRHA